MKLLSFYCLIFGILLVEVSTKPTSKGVHYEPCANPLECLHGVMMHGDKDVGESHEAEDGYLRFKSVLDTGTKEPSGPKDAEETFHGALMHGDSDDGKHNSKIDQPQRPYDSVGPKDTNQLMHDVMHGDTERSHEHTLEQKTDTETKDKAPEGPPDAEKIMHDVLMHGDDKTENHHVHSRPEDTIQAPNGPMDQNTLMHDLMHDGKHVEHSDDQSKTSGGQSGPNSDQLHGVLMHGDSNLGHNHDHDHKNSENAPFKFNIEEIKKLGIDPDILKTVFSDDNEDYQKWQEEKKSQTEEDYYKASYASISDSLLSDIEIMKQRYLARDPADDEEINKELEAKDATLNFEDVVAALESESMYHNDDDMLHDLELIGSTVPINEIHQDSHHDPRRRR